MEQQQLNWLNEEEEKIDSYTEFEKIPDLKFVEGVETTLTIDASKPFAEWKKEENGVLIHKKILPVTTNGLKKNWWISVRNPIYREIIKALKTGKNTFVITSTGTGKDTRYSLK
jgi:hypothetical protein